MLSIHNDIVLGISILIFGLALLCELYLIMGRKKTRKLSKKYISFHQPLTNKPKHYHRDIMKVGLRNMRESVNRLIYSKFLKPSSSSTKNDKSKSSSQNSTITPTNLKGCEFDGENMDKIMEIFPNDNKADVHRFLIARKGDVDLAAEMYRNSLLWREKNLPGTVETIGSALDTKCLFIGKPALDGTATLYFRSALFDSRVIPSEAFVIAAAHGLDYALKFYKANAITVMVDISSVPGAPNLSADINFIKSFVKVMSDVFPERLQKLLVFPFPWYGKAIWSLIAVFLDKRTRDKVILCSSKGDERLPQEVFSYLSVSNIPECCGGKDKSPTHNLLSTLRNNSSADAKKENSNTRSNSLDASLKSENFNILPN